MSKIVDRIVNKTIKNPTAASCKVGVFEALNLANNCSKPSSMNQIQSIKIGNSIIGKGQPIFIIAEVGVNHNGDLETAKRLVDIAVDAGVDAVKFQTWKTEALILQNTEKTEYQKEQTGDGSQFDMIKKLEKGVIIEVDKKDYKTKPAKVEKIDDNNCFIYC